MLMERKDSDVIAEIEAIGRTRSLTPSESRRLEDAIRRSGDGPWGRSVKGQRPWTPKDERQLASFVLKRMKVPEIAAKIGRTERAVWKKLQLLRKAGKVGYFSPIGGTGRYPRKSSMADGQPEGV